MQQAIRRTALESWFESPLDLVGKIVGYGKRIRARERDEGFPVWNRQRAYLIRLTNVGKRYHVGSEEGTLEHAERNICEEYVGRGLRDYVSDWIFERSSREGYAMKIWTGAVSTRNRVFKLSKSA